MDLVHHHEADVGQMLAQTLAREHDLKGLGSGDEQLGRVLDLPIPLGLGGVAVTDAHLEVQLVAKLSQTAQHVPIESPQGRDVEDGERPVGSRPRLGLGLGCLRGILGLLLLIVNAPSPEKKLVQDGDDGGLGLAHAGGAMSRQ